MIRVFITCVTLLVAVPAWAEINIKEVTSPGGINAWLVEEPSIPFVALELRFRGGTSLDLPGKRGATNLMVGLLEEGTDTLDAQGFAKETEALAAQLLNDLGILDAFGALVGADTLPVRKPDPAPLIETVSRLGGDPRSCLLVGDSDTDRNTAKAAGVPSVLVTFGPSGEDMAALEPQALLEDYAALPQVVRTLLGPALG